MLFGPVQEEGSWIEKDADDALMVIEDGDWGMMTMTTIMVMIIAKAYDDDDDDDDDNHDDDDDWLNLPRNE